MQVEIGSTSPTINGIQIVVGNDHENNKTSEINKTCDRSSHIQESADIKRNHKITKEDLSLLCDLFYLPFEHGGQGIQLLQEFNWLKSNAQIVIHKPKDGEPTLKADVRKFNFS